MKVETLDLHGMGLEEALAKTRINLKWCLEHGVEVLDINHGKGYHSSRNFSVLKQEIRHWLKEDKSLAEHAYVVIYGESTQPVALTFDEGHTLVVARGKEKEYIGGKKQQARNEAVFSPAAKKQRRNQKSRDDIKRKKPS